MALALGAGIGVGMSACSKSETQSEPSSEVESEPADEKEAEAGVDFEAMAARIGVAPGGWTYGEQGAEAAVTEREGTVEVRRVGEEQFAAAAEGAVELHAGDQVRTGADSRAVVVLADRTVVELAAESAFAVGDRGATADPASSAAVLYGVARFTVSGRADGEGAFLVYTPSGIVAAKGTVFGVGAAATGSTRVGVEEGAVEVAGSAELDAAVAVESGKAVVMEAEGEVEEQTEFKKDDWATWRVEAESSAEVAATAQAHAEAMAELEAELTEGYAELETLTTAVAEAETEAEAQAESKNRKAYAKLAGEVAADVEASFATTVRLQHLTYAMLAHGYAVGELYVRHPEKVEPIYTSAEAHAKGSLLFHKKFHGVVAHHITPVRAAYYKHHARGRARAKAVGKSVPSFFAKVKVKAVPEAKVASRVKAAAYTPPVKFKTKAKASKKVWLGAPDAGWIAKVKVKPAEYRGEAWYAVSGQGAAKAKGEAKGKAEAAGKAAAKAGAAAEGALVAGTAVKAKIPAVFVKAKKAVKAKQKVAIGVTARGKAAAGAGAGAAAGAAAAGKAGAAGAGKAAGAARGQAKAGAAVEGGARAAGEANGAAGAAKGAVEGGARAAGKAKGAVEGGARAAGKAKGAVKAGAKGAAGAAGKAKAGAEGAAGAAGGVTGSVKGGVTTRGGGKAKGGGKAEGGASGEAEGGGESEDKDLDVKGEVKGTLGGSL